MNAYIHLRSYIVFQCAIMMMIFRDGILSYINWYLHKCKATKSVAEIFKLDTCNQYYFM